MATRNIQRNRQSGNPATRDAGVAALDPALRARIATAIEDLIALLDQDEPQTEDTPIFEGHPAYQPFTLAEANHVGAASLDPDTESDTADDEDDADDEEDDPAEDDDSDDDRDRDNAVDMAVVDGFLTVDDGDREIDDPAEDDDADEAVGDENEGGVDSPIFPSTGLDWHEQNWLQACSRNAGFEDADQDEVGMDRS